MRYSWSPEQGFYPDEQGDWVQTDYWHPALGLLTFYVLAEAP